MRYREYGKRKTGSRLTALALLLLLALAMRPSSASSNVSGVRDRRGAVAVSLTWSGNIDLDLHVTGLGPNGRRFRVCYWNRSEHGCRLDGDALAGGGSESVRILDASLGPYQVYVHDYSNRLSGDSDALMSSGAAVEISCHGTRKEVFRVPDRRSGTLWSVCTVEESSITPLKRMTYEEKPGYVGRSPESNLIPGDILMGTKPDTNVPTRWSHVGIYAGGGRVIEASDIGRPVTINTLEDWDYPDMTYVSYYRVPAADERVRRKAVRFAEERAREEDWYDVAFYTKQVEGDSWYCSELVWAAYMKASNGAINIEKTPDFLGVYPWEIEHSGEVALLGGHYEKLPRNNWLRLTGVGLQKLYQFVLAPAGKWVALAFVDSLKYPQFVLGLFLCFAIVVTMRNGGSTGGGDGYTASGAAYRRARRRHE